MTTCERVSERIVEAAHGAPGLDDAELAHLAVCAGCRRESAVVALAMATPSRPVLDPDRVAHRVLQRLASPETAVLPFERRRRGLGPWLVGLAAAAALAFAVVQTLRPDPDQAGSAVLLGELDDLSPSELEMVFEEMPANSAEPVMPVGAAGMSDLTTDELERVLDTWGG